MTTNLYPLWLDGRLAGQASLTEEGGAARCTVECELLTDGLYRAYLRGGGGEQRLGVLEPSEGALRLRRRLTREELRLLGPIERATAARSFSFAPEEDWRALDERPFFGDARLEKQLRAIPGALRLEDGTRRGLALPYDPGAPFPLPELFCFASMENVRGRACAVYRFGHDGAPLCPPRA